MKGLSFPILVIFISSVCSQSNENLHVTILYESLCPDSINFIQNQLTPSYPYLKDFIDITFVPFGKSQSLNNGSFICQHGENECVGNKIQSCALNQLQSQDSQVSFVQCQMPNPDLTGKICSELIGLNYDAVLNCFNSDIGTNLQLEAEEITKKIAPVFIPTILYNHQFNQQLQDNSLEDFLSVVCSLTKNFAPICTHSSMP